MNPALTKAAVAAITGATLMCGPATAATAASGVVPVRAGWVGDGGVVSHLPLRIRYGPTTADGIDGALTSGIRLWIACKVRGQYVRSNGLWYRLGDGRGYVSARYVRNYRQIPWCG
jgi:hypothetical protein